MPIGAALAARLFAGGGHESVRIDGGDPPGPSRLPAFTNMRDRQRAKNDEVGVDFAVAAQLGGQVVAAAARADVAAQKTVGRYVARIAGEWAAAVIHD